RKCIRHIKVKCSKSCQSYTLSAYRAASSSQNLLKKMKVMQEKYNNGMKFWLCVLIIKWL
ncbi:hypothetical protein QZL07_16370, partial [Acinetobacter baumannii]|nr:hypothetical protein [Acinetobacter baumannii]